MSEFTELYRTLSNSELLKIISESEKYKSVAVETAKLEIESRKLSQHDLQEARNQIKAKEEAKKLKKEKLKNKEDWLKQNAFTFFETISPIQNGIQTPERIIRLITVLFAAIAIYKVYREFWFISYMLNNGLDNWDLSTLVYLLELALFPIAVILFWKRKKIGWILLTLLVTSSAISSLGLFFDNFNRQPSSLPGLDKLFPTVSPMTYFTAFIFYGASLWLICKKSVSSFFKVSEKTVFLAVSLTIIAQLIVILLLLD